MGPKSRSVEDPCPRGLFCYFTFCFCIFRGEFEVLDLCILLVAFTFLDFRCPLESVIIDISNMTNASVI